MIFRISLGKNKNHENLEFSRNLGHFKYDFKTNLASFVRIEVVNNKSIVSNRDTGPSQGLKIRRGT